MKFEDCFSFLSSLTKPNWCTLKRNWNQTFLLQILPKFKRPGNKMSRIKPFQPHLESFILEWPDCTGSPPCLQEPEPCCMSLWWARYILFTYWHPRTSNASLKPFYVFCLWHACWEMDLISGEDMLYCHCLRLAKQSCMYGLHFRLNWSHRLNCSIFLQHELRGSLFGKVFTLGL